jgi:hypothetical protein
MKSKQKTFPFAALRNLNTIRGLPYMTVVVLTDICAFSSQPQACYRKTFAAKVHVPPCSSECFAIQKTLPHFTLGCPSGRSEQQKDSRPTWAVPKRFSYSHSLEASHPSHHKNGTPSEHGRSLQHCYKPLALQVRSPSRLSALHRFDHTICGHLSYLFQDTLFQAPFPISFASAL